MKLLITILSLTLIVSCGVDNEETQQQVETTIEKIAERIDSVEVAADSVEAVIDTVTSPPQTSPLLQDQSGKSISELWSTYKKAKDDVNKALDKNDIAAVVSNLALAGECALQLGRMDIAAWQFNNVGHYSIMEFKRRTGYDQRLQKLATMPAGNAKTGYQLATKDLFFREFPVLENAQNYLVQAQIIDDELEQSRRTGAIQSNIDYIEWIKNFTGIDRSL